MAFDLTSVSGLALKDTAVLHLKHPVTDELLFDGDKKEVTVTLYGQASKQYRNAITAMQNRELRRKAKKDVATAEQIQDEATSLLVACSADSTLQLDGEAVNDKDMFKKLYTDSRFAWVREQVDAFLGETSRFLSQ